MIPQLELALPESQVDKRIADCVRAVHCIRQIVAACGKISAEKVGVANCGQNPCGGVPVGFWFGKQIPCGPVPLKCLCKCASSGASVTLFAEFCDLRVCCVG